MSVLLFVYGTLKEGFPNHHRNLGRRVPGEYRTVAPHHLLVVRLPQEERAPWLLPAPEGGVPVRGQVFEIDDEQLAAVDHFEGVGRPDGYARMPLALERLDAPGQLQAWGYLKQPHQLPACLATEGPFDEYTLALAEGYWIRTPD